MSMIKVIITGAHGQLGRELALSVPAGVSAVLLDRSKLDIRNREEVSAIIERERPDWLINAAAYTAVDKAESEAELAHQINADGAQNLALACAKVGARMVQVSTDFVFDGNQNTPYSPGAACNPQGVYGASKLVGEHAVQGLLPENALILRTSWVYSSFGNNFVKTMLRLMAERDELGIVIDQVGTPSWARNLAVLIWRAVEQELCGLFHWSDYGLTSWYDFAVAIQKEAQALALLDSACRIRPIMSEQYPTPARRPHYSVLDKSDIVEALDWEPYHWQHALKAMLQDYQTRGSK